MTPYSGDRPGDGLVQDMFWHVPTVGLNEEKFQ
jgi:hypothetical protein